MNSNSITYLLHSVSGLMEKFEGQILKDIFNISFSQFRVMLAVSHGHLSQKEIADYWNITEAAVSRQVECLVKNELLKRKVNPKNRRKNTIEVTEKGKKKLDAAIQYIEKRYEEVFTNFDFEKQKNLSGSLRIIVDSIGSKI